MLNIFFTPLSLFAGDLPLDRLVVIRPHPGIEAAGGSQLLMGALLHDASLLQYQNLVRTYDSRQTVGDHDNGAATGQLGKRLLDQRLVLRVGKGGCFKTVALMWGDIQDIFLFGCPKTIDIKGH